MHFLPVVVEFFCWDLEGVPLSMRAPEAKIIMTVKGKTEGKMIHQRLIKGIFISVLHYQAGLRLSMDDPLPKPVSPLTCVHAKGQPWFGLGSLPGFFYDVTP